MDTAPYEHLLASCEAARCAAHGTRRASTCTREEYRLLHRGYRLARRLATLQANGVDMPEYLVETAER